MRVQLFALAGLILMMGLPAASQEGGGIPRTADGRPDLTGIYDANTLTQIERPAKYGGREALTDQEAADLLRAQATRDEEADKPSDPNRKAPKAGNTLAGKSYDDFWKSFGNRVVTIGGEKRSSIVIDPPDGKIPPMTEEGNARDDRHGGLAGRTDVLERRGPRPDAFDDPEASANSERCLLGFGWTSGTPILPNYLYNNLKQIVQTPTEIMIETEMIHDARIVRIGGKHPPSSIRKWLGDSVGHWEGDTLVVETTNFTDKTRFRGSSRIRSPSGSRGSTPTRCCIASPSKTRIRGRGRGLASIRGRPARSGCSSTPVTRTTTPWAGSCVGPGWPNPRQRRPSQNISEMT